MAQTKILIDSNVYFRLAESIHPLLQVEFGQAIYCLYVIKDLQAEYNRNPRLRNAFSWVNETEYRRNRACELNGFTLEELIRDMFRLRNALEAKIVDAKRQAMQQIHEKLLLAPEEFTVNDRSEVVFEQGRYAYDSIYCGFAELPKHFFTQIGNLKGEGEEFECALFLATQLEGVKFWVRNVERKATSFSLQTGSDRFYPDFLCKMENGSILAVEYKGGRDWDLPENIEKRRLGELWERRSNGKCFFVMPKGKDFEAIRRKVSEALKSI